MYVVFVCFLLLLFFFFFFFFFFFLCFFFFFFFFVFFVCHLKIFHYYRILQMHRVNLPVFANFRLSISPLSLQEESDSNGMAENLSISYGLNIQRGK